MSTKASTEAGYLHPDLLGLDFVPEQTPTHRRFSISNSNPPPSLSAKAVPFFHPLTKVQPDIDKKTFDAAARTFTPLGEYDTYDSSQATISTANATPNASILMDWSSEYADKAAIHDAYSQYQVPERSQGNYQETQPTLDQHYLRDAFEKEWMRIYAVQSRQTQPPAEVPAAYNQGMGVQPNALSLQRFPWATAGAKENQAFGNLNPPGLYDANAARQHQFDALIAPNSLEAEEGVLKPSWTKGDFLQLLDQSSPPTLKEAIRNPEVRPADREQTLSELQGMATKRKLNSNNVAVPPKSGDSMNFSFSFGPEIKFDDHLHEISTTLGLTGAVDEVIDDDKVDTSIDDRAGANGGEAESKSTLKRKRRAARSALIESWEKREGVRGRLAGTWTLDCARALKDATKTYNVKRLELEKCMASGELPEEDARAFPHFSTTDLSVPKVKPSGIQKAPSKDTLSSNIATTKQKPKASSTPEVDLNELYAKALQARKLYEDAYAYFDRDPPQGRAKLRDLRAQGEARIERAAKLYRQKIEEVGKAYPLGIPDRLNQELWLYDDKAEKRRRRARWGH